jgi:ribonuclease BN (tRNA processing enzyme)
LFLTHLHSDHTLGFPDLIFTPWTLGPLGRQSPLVAYGPKGIKDMVNHLIQAYQVDIEERWKSHQIPSPQIDAHEVRAGLIYKDGKVQVTAFPTKHSIESYGYRFDTPDSSIVISGDTSPTQSVVEACHGCDFLIHEVYSLAFLKTRPPGLQASAARVHTTTAQLAEIAERAKPGLLILTHLQAASPEEALKEMKERYSGRVAAGHDLDVY